MKDVLLILHGALGSKAQFEQLKEGLSDSYDVHTLNFEGHGGLPSDHPFSIQRFAQNLLDYLHDHSIESATIFGYSMGGYVALSLALQHPNRIKKILTLGTKFDWTIESAEKEVKMLNPEKIEEKIPHFALHLSKLHQPADWKQVMHKTTDMMLNLAKGDKLMDADLINVSVPVVIGIGSLDNMVTLAESRHAVEQLPNASLVVLEDVKHPIEQVDAGIVRHFIVSN